MPKEQKNIYYQKCNKHSKQFDVLIKHRIRCRTLWFPVQRKNSQSKLAGSSLTKAVVFLLPAALVTHYTLTTPPMVSRSLLSLLRLYPSTFLPVRLCSSITHSTVSLQLLHLPPLSVWPFLVREKHNSAVLNTQTTPGKTILLSAPA